MPKKNRENPQWKTAGIGRAARSGALVGTLGAVLLIVAAAAFGSDIQVIDTAQISYRISADQISPPNDETRYWEPIQLKDLWPLRRRLIQREAWYRIHFAGPSDPGQDFAMFIPRVSSVASFWVNGIEIGNTGSFADPLPRNWNFPVWQPLPKQLIRPGENQLEIHLKTDLRRMGYLFEISVGPSDVVRSQYDFAYFAKITATRILSVVMTLSVIILLAFYFTTRLSISYLWFAIGTLFWAVFCMNLIVRDIPIPGRVWDALMLGSAWLALIFYIKSVISIYHLHRPKFQMFLLGVLLLFVSGILFLPELASVVVQALFVITIYCSMVLVGFGLTLKACLTQVSHRYWLIGTGISLVVFSLWDMVSLYLQITRDFAKFPYLPIIAILGGATVFVQKLIATSWENEKLKREMPQQQQVAMQEAVQTERQRLMREIHDGVGGQLVSTIARLEKGEAVQAEIVDSLKQSLDDLRLIVHSLESLSQQGDIPTLLATIRERLARGLQQQEIAIDWQVRALPAVKHFNAEHALQLMRIIQEAITNTLKHGKADRIFLRCQQSTNRDETPGILIEIGDNGQGFDTEAKSVGLGIKNMRERVRFLQGELQIKSRPGETIISIWLPFALQPAPNAQPMAQT